MISLDTSKIEFSYWDKHFGVILPESLTKDLAYEIGVHIGDGYCGIRNYVGRNYIGGKFYDICYSGNVITEYLYYENILKPLITKLFGKKVNVEKCRRNECRIKFQSKAILLFKNKVIGLSLSPKDNIRIPDILFQENQLLSSCLEGIGDTDFSLVFQRKHKDVNYYPKLRLVSKSKILVEQLEQVIKNILKVNVLTEYDVRRLDKRTNKVYISNSLELNGKKALDKWMKIIGSKNYEHITKYQVWKILGYSPKLSIIERIKIIESSPSSSVSRACTFDDASMVSI